MTSHEIVPLSNDAISFVVHGPVQSTPDRWQEQGLTARCLSGIRKSFPGSKIICSTWKGQPVEGLDADIFVLSDDPGPRVSGFDRKNVPIIRNLERQALSVRKGLDAVKTPYAVKLRSDNIHNSRAMLALYETYSRQPFRSDRFSLLAQRVLITTYWASEYSRGLRIPFFFSDFFHLGLTEDVRKIWDLPVFQDYQWNETLSGARQHASYPWPQRCVEQIIYSSLAEKAGLCDIVTHKYDLGSERVNKLGISDALLVDNFIMVDPDMLCLDVPKRLEHPESYRYYSFKRWEQLFARRYPESGYAYDRAFAVRRLLSCIKTFISKGLKMKMRLFFRRVRVYSRRRQNAGGQPRSRYY